MYFEIYARQHGTCVIFPRLQKLQTLQTLHSGHWRPTRGFSELVTLDQTTLASIQSWPEPACMSSSILYSWSSFSIVFWTATNILERYVCSNKQQYCSMHELCWTAVHAVHWWHSALMVYCNERWAVRCRRSRWCRRFWLVDTQVKKILRVWIDFEGNGIR